MDDVLEVVSLALYGRTREWSLDGPFNSHAPYIALIERKRKYHHEVRCAFAPSICSVCIVHLPWGQQGATWPCPKAGELVSDVPEHWAVSDGGYRRALPLVWQGDVVEEGVRWLERAEVDARRLVSSFLLARERGEADSIREQAPFGRLLLLAADGQEVQPKREVSHV
jgi:hypothetical protein